MTSLKMTSSSFAVAWLSRLFLTAVPFSFALRIFDVYMHQGCEVHLRVGLALLRSNMDALLLCKSESAFLAKLTEGCKSLPLPAKVLDKAWKYKTSSVVSAWEKQRGKSSGSQQKSKGSTVKAGAASSSKVSASPLPSSSNKLKMFYPNLDFKSRIMATDDWNFIYNWMPMRFTIRDPVLLHSMDQEGTSLPLIYKTLSNYEPTLVVVKTKQERVRYLPHIALFIM
jgi:hypothetical protein